MTADHFAVIDATWPAARSVMAGGFRVREGLGGGSRVSSASLEVPFSGCDIDVAIRAQESLGQEAKFMLRPDDLALDAALAARGFEIFDPVIIYDMALADVPEPAGVTAQWPPEPEASALWDEGHIGAERRLVMERAASPKVALMGRIDAQPAAAAFVGLHGDIAMLHALVTLPRFRRRGLGRKMMEGVMQWARAQGASRLSLVVTEANEAANRLYAGLGMAPVTRYHYRRPKA